MQCSDELLEWSKNKTLRAELDKRNTVELKEICQENKILRTGPKYEVIANILAHIQGFKLQQEKRQLEKCASINCSGSAISTTSAKVELEVMNLKSFKTVSNFTCKFEKRLALVKDITNKFEMLFGLTKGVQKQIKIAVTGPSRAQYNGKWGTLAEDVNNDLAGYWLDFFTIHYRDISIEQLRKWVILLSETPPCDGFGYPSVITLIGDDVISKCITDEASIPVKNELLEIVNSSSQFMRGNFRQKLYESRREPFIVNQKMKSIAPVKTTTATSVGKDDDEDYEGSSIKKRKYARPETSENGSIEVR